MLNGLTGVDNDEGHFTFISHMEKSVIDYVISNMNNFHLAKDFIFDDLTQCEHFPIIVKFHGMSTYITKKYYR
jgi:hypothetical protein